jgi:ribosome recycling factor
MSEPVQSILEAVLRLTHEQRREFMETLAKVESHRPSLSASRRELVESIKGKYRHVPTSSESFISRKEEDLALESRQ